MAEHITVDGEAVTIPHGHHEVAEILSASGVTPRGYDLIRIDSDGQHVVTHRIGDAVVTEDGDQFITAHISTTTA